MSHTYRLFAEAAEFVLARGTVNRHRENGSSVSGRGTCASVSGHLLLWTVALRGRRRLVHLANDAGLARLCCCTTVQMVSQPARGHQVRVLSNSISK